MSIKISGAIFDLDGTLLDSMPVWKNLGRDFLIKKGIDPGPGLPNRLEALSLEQAARMLRSRYNLPDSTQDILAQINAMIENLYVDVFSLKEGALDFLWMLNRRGVAMCVATATDEGLARAALKRNNAEHFFKGVISCGQLETDKTLPDIYLGALKILGTAKQETWVFEDSLHALTTAKNAGFKTVTIHDASSRHKPDSLTRFSDVLLSDYHQAKKIFA